MQLQRSQLHEGTLCTVQTPSNQQQWLSLVAAAGAGTLWGDWPSGRGLKLLLSIQQRVGLRKRAGCMRDHVAGEDIAAACS